MQSCDPSPIIIFPFFTFLSTVFDVSGFLQKIVYVLNINIFAFIEEASTKLDVLINVVSKSFTHARI